MINEAHKLAYSILESAPGSMRLLQAENKYRNCVDILR